MSTTFYVGIDIACDDFQVALGQTGGSQAVSSFANEFEGFRQLARHLKRHCSEQTTLCLVMEPTGGYELALVAFAHQQGWQVALPNPLHVRRWAESCGIRAKTDRVDAQVLAAFGVERQPVPQAPLPSHVAELDEMLRRKEDLEKMLRQEQNRQHALDRRPGVPAAVTESLDSMIDALTQGLCELEQQIKAHLANHSDLVHYRQLLLSVPGIGLHTVLYILVFLYRWQVLTQGEGNAKGLTAYAGLDPAPFRSGRSVHKRTTISKQGNRQLRRRVVHGAFGGIRGDNPLRQFYLRLVGRNKPKRLAQVAAARKMLVWAWAVFRSQTAFQPDLAVSTHA